MSLIGEEGVTKISKTNNKVVSCGVDKVLSEDTKPNCDLKLYTVKNYIHLM